SLAKALQTISRSVTMPIRWSFSPIGIAPMSYLRINFASSEIGVSGPTHSTPLCIAIWTFIMDLPWCADAAAPLPPMCFSSSLLAFSNLAFFWPRSADRRARRTFFDWRLPAISASLLLDFQFHRTTPAEAICSSLARCGAEAESPLEMGKCRSGVVGGNLRSRLFLIFLAEAAFDQPDQRLKRSIRLLALGLDQNRVALASGEHHQSHDRSAEDSVAFARHPHRGGVARRAAYELGRGPRMQALLVGYHQLGKIEAVARLFLVRLRLCNLLHCFG